MSAPTITRQANRSKGFQSLDEELAIDRLPVSGELPPWLSGTLVRVTPALLDVGGKPIVHWFDGIGMLNAFSFSNGRVAYASRFLHTRAYANARDGKFGQIGFAQDPCRAFFKRTTAMLGANPSDNCNINVARLGERYVAMTETPLPVEFDLDTLDTAGTVKWRDRVGGHLTTAHPHFDHRRGELVNYVSHLSARSTYRLFAIPKGTTRRREIARIPVREPAYMHSFSMTDRYVVLTELPLVVDPLRLTFSGKPLIHNYRWEPERGTRFLIVDRHSGELRATCQGEPFFAFHHVNAFERDGEVVLDVVVHEPGPAAIEALEVERLRGGGGPVRPTTPWRFRVPLSGRDATGKRLSDTDLELPRIDYPRDNGRDYAHFYAVGYRGADSDWLDRIVKLDIRDGGELDWSQDGCYPGEPIHVRAPGEDPERGGVLLSVVLDAYAGRSFLLVLDAGTLAEVARAAVPHHIPFGFHGDYFPAPSDPRVLRRRSPG